MKKIFYISFIALLLLCSGAYAAKKKVVYVRNNSNTNDTAVITAIANYGGGSVYDVQVLVNGTPTMANLPMFEAADVVVMGRNIPSGNVAGGIWDSITKPVITSNMWGLRNSRAKWVNSGTCWNVSGFPDTVIRAIVKVNDPVFEGVAVNDTIDWWNGRYSIFGNENNSDDAGNGTLLAATVDSLPLFIRWQAGVEFYPGAGHKPKGERAYIGLASDDGGVVKYFSYTDVSRKIFFNELARMVGGITPKEVIYVRSGSPITKGDSAVVASINNYEDGKVFHVRQLVRGDMVSADLDSLNSGDVVIMGRNIGSSTVGGDMVIWDSIAKPVLSMNMYGLRNNRAKWVNSDLAGNTTADASAIFEAKITKKSDNIFNGLSDTIDWWSGSFSFFGNISNNDNYAGNGQILVKTLDGLPLLIRWKDSIEYYSGCGHFPLSDRSYIGSAGDQGKDYFNYTDESSIIFFRELGRLAAGVPTVLEMSTNADLSTITASIGILTPAFNSDTLLYTVDLPASWNTTSLPTISYTPSVAYSTVEMVSAATFADTNVITVTAEDTNVVKIYKVAYKLLPANTNANLKELMIKFNSLIPAFNADSIVYLVKLPAGTDTIPFVTSALPADTNATVVIVDATSLEGSSTVTVTAEDGVSTKTYTISYEVAVGIKDNTLSKVKIYPSPVSEILNIANVRNAVVTIYSLDGMLVNKVNLADNNSTINVSNLSSGIYLINIKSEGKELNARFIKK